VEFEKGRQVEEAAVLSKLRELADQHEHTRGIERFLVHPSFPVDVRHNAKIFREKLAAWAQEKSK
jgi:hypothetical protein